MKKLYFAFIPILMTFFLSITASASNSTRIDYTFTPWAPQWGNGSIVITVPDGYIPAMVLDGNWVAYGVDFKNNSYLRGASIVYSGSQNGVSHTVNSSMGNFPGDASMSSFSKWDITGDLYVFPSVVAFNNAKNGDFSGADYVPEVKIDYDPLHYDYDSRVEAPVVQYIPKSNTITFVNGSDGVGVTAFCRWLSVNDIYLDYDLSVGNLSGTLDWSMSVLDGKNRSFATYRDVVKSSFVESIPVTDGQPSTSSILLYPVTSGNSPFISSFNDLISVYPPSQRSITGRNTTNPLTGSNFAWFDNAEASLRESLGSFRNSLSVPEIYFRFYQVIDGELCFSKWTKFTMSLNMDKYTHDWTTYTDNEYGNDVTPPSYNTGVVDTNEPIVNNAPVSVGSNTQNTVSVNTQSNTVDININSVDWSQYIKTFQNSLGLFGNFSAFVSTVFTFLPSWIVAMLGSTVTLLCGLAVYHGIRG